MRRFIFPLFVTLATMAPLTPSRAIDPPTREVTVSGTATIKVAPDEMNWTVQVSINDATLAKAKDRHDSSLAAAIRYINGLGGAVKDLQTGGIRFDKRMFPVDDPDVKAHPFTCSTQFTFTLVDFAKYGAMADALARFDGLQVQGVDYAYSKADSVQEDALKQALLNAYDKANNLAVAANCYINRPLKIEEGGTDNGPRPMMRMAMAGAAPEGTPAAVPGQLEISASVTATYDMFYK